MPGAQRIPRPTRVTPGAPAPWERLAVDARSFSIEEVRAACTALPTPQPALHLPREPRAAAVVLLCAPIDGEVCVVMIKRPEHMPTHQGQIAFPGGAHQANDADLRATALRETVEEIGVDGVEIIGELDTIATVASPFVVTPFVGLLEAEPRITPDPGEVAAIVAVPIATLLDAAIFREELWDLEGVELFTPPERSVYFFELPDETVWGATARILTGFLSHLAATR